MKRSGTIIEVPIMPEQYKGGTKKNCGYTKTTPRKWTTAEIEWVKRLRIEGYTIPQIAFSIGRTEAATSLKIKRISKESPAYNISHVSEKYQVNAEFVKHIKATCVLDVYAGEKSFYDGLCGVIANDKSETAETPYHMDALKFCCLMYSDGLKADIVDLDPFGSAYDCFDLAVKIAQKGLVITFGELGHKRFKRLDFVGSHYGIETLEDFSLDRLIAEVQTIGRRNKKSLKVYARKECKNIGRVWFEIEPLKVTEQWEGVL